MKKKPEIEPAPGSDAAIKMGCKCPVMDNNNGKGYMGLEGVFVYNLDCKVHQPKRKARQEP